MKLDTEFDRDIIIYAFRYALPRHSYAPGLMRDKLDEIWNQISDGDKKLILREIQDHNDYIHRIYEGKEIPKMDLYDLKEWMVWRERKLMG